jgi:putative DNA-invertase from lambdoid prophage Rac
LQQYLIASLAELRDLGIAFVSLTEALDFTTSAGRAMVGLLSVFAEFERDMIRERVKAERVCFSLRPLCVCGGE